MTRLAAALLFCLAASAHEGGLRISKPTRAQKDLDRARRTLDAAKRKLTTQGKYTCCVKPSCDLCARRKGRCDCAATAAAGKGACGECAAGWLAGRGTLPGVKTAGVLGDKLDATDTIAELKESLAALLTAKRTLVEEKRFNCCVKGGCGQCAHEGYCPCGSDLAQKKATGVCGDCAHGWHSGEGAFAGVALDEVRLALMEPMDLSMGPGGGKHAGWYQSGTSQGPRSAPMNMVTARIGGGWSFHVMGQAFGVQTMQSGPRGKDKFFSPNWLMPMVSRRIGRSTVAIRAMLSFEPATVTQGRYPMLFQSGEVWKGLPILNGQHPHDFVGELAGIYQLRLGERTVLTLYGGPRGEPALGPGAFPHRWSASENPVAVLSHHYQDSTHISNNVATAGITHGPVTWEVSGFHGREPDDRRWNLEGGAIDSLSTRLTVSPTARWSGQFSIGRVNNRESTHPVRDSLRTSASLTYVRPMDNGHWASTAVWGRNHDLEFTQPPRVLPRFAAGAPGGYVPYHFSPVPTRIPGQIYNSFLAESTLLWRGKHWIWGRAENVDRDTLLLYEEDPFLVLAEERRYTRIQAYTAGYARELKRAVPWLSTSLGGQFTTYAPSQRLSPIYGEHPWSVQIFLRLRVGGPGR